MNVKINTARHFLENKDLAICTDAAALLALHLDDRGKTIAHKAKELMDEENRARMVQGLLPRSRMNAKDVERAIEALAKVNGERR